MTLFRRYVMVRIPMLRCIAGLAALLAVAPAFGQTPAPAPAPAKAPAKCTDCGVVQSIRFVEEEGKASGLGAVAGGVVGGVIGHQIGGGTGKTVATIAGAGGGAYVGHQVEKSKNKQAYWAVTIKMDGGTARTFHYTTKPGVQEGERVKLVDGGKRLALVAN
jgi:outer membrane lipoprotein SlyB